MKIIISYNYFRLEEEEVNDKIKLVKGGGRSFWGRGTKRLYFKFAF